MPQADFIKVQKFLSGVDYPADKAQLIEHARAKGADEESVRALKSIPDHRYDGPSAVSKAIAKS
jgi:Protein of unknown function (DUF2795)